MANDYSINAIITADSKQFTSELKKVTGETKTVTSKMGSLGKTLTSTFAKGGVIAAGVAVAVKALKTLGDELKRGIKLYEESNQKQKLLAQTLKVTGANAWTSAERLNAMADSLQKVTNYTSDEITELQTVLLGFKNITEDNFDEATEAILDMATVMGMDLKSACQTVGKALDDPIKGLGSLARQGFQFSEAEKQMLEEMVAVGDIAKAQDVILKELNTTYGGAAKAGAKATTQLKNSWDDLVKEMGRGIVLNIDVGPAIQKLQKLIDDFKRVMQENNDAAELTDKLIEAEKAIESKTATDEQVILVYENKIKLMEQEYRQYEGLLGIEDEYAKENLDRLDKEKAGYEKQIEYAQKRIEFYKYLNEMAAARAQQAAAEADNEATIAKLKEDHLEKIKEQEKQWELTAQVTGQAVSNEEKLKFYQEDLVSILQEANGQISKQNEYYKTQMGIISDLEKKIVAANAPKKTASNEWEKKLRDQNIERLEAEKETMKQSNAYAQMSAEERYNIEKRYNDKILQLKWDRLLEERNAALESIKGVENEEEEKARIMDYYQHEIDDLVKEYGRGAIQAGGEVGAETGKEFVSKFDESMQQIKNVCNSIIKIIKKVGSVIKSVFSKFSLKKVFDFNPDTALDGLLAFEDKVLTFFIETVPKLPAFFKSALQSISVMLSTIKLNINKSQIKKMIDDFIKTIKTYIPDILQTGLEIATEIIGGIGEGIKNNQAQISQILMSLTNIIVQFLPDIVLGIIDALSNLLAAIPDEMLVKLVDGVIGLVTTLAVRLIENAAMIASKLIPALFEIVEATFKAFPSILKEVLYAVVQGLGKLATTIWNGIKKLFGWATGTNDAPRGLALVGEAGPELVDFRGGERVINNANTQKLLANAGSGGGSVFNVTFENTIDTTAFAMMKQLKQYQRNLAFNGVL